MREDQDAGRTSRQAGPEIGEAEVPLDRASEKNPPPEFAGAQTPLFQGKTRPAAARGNIAERCAPTPEDHGNIVEDMGKFVEDRGNIAEDMGNTPEDRGNIIEDMGKTIEERGNMPEDMGKTPADHAATPGHRGRGSRRTLPASARP